MTIIPWADRSAEQARLLNPAFLAALIWSCSEGYYSVSQQGVPYPLLFIAMPVVLHKSSRDSLPRSIRTSLAAWIGDNPSAHINFLERATSLVPIVKEGVIYGINAQALSMSFGQVLPGQTQVSRARFLRSSSNEVEDCMDKSRFVGRWFASSGNYATTMALWGVMP
jgi:hypothetical protein